MHAAFKVMNVHAHKYTNCRVCPLAEGSDWCVDIRSDVCRRRRVCVCAQVSRSGSRDRLVLQRSGFLLRVYSVRTICTCVYASVYHISIQLPPHTLCTVALLCAVKKVKETITYVHDIYMYAKNMVSFTRYTHDYFLINAHTRAYSHVWTCMHMYIQRTQRAHRQDNKCWIQ